MTLAADIIAKQNAGGDCYEYDGGTVTDAGYKIDDDGTCGFSPSNHSVSDSSVIDDYLGTLSSNGGPTQTIPLLVTPSPFTSSPDPAAAVIPSTFALPVAENGVTLACSIPDQRGVTRAQPCDIGAFELTAALSAGAPEVALPLLLPLTALALGGVGYTMNRRRTRRAKTTVA